MTDAANEVVIVHLDGEYIGWHATFRPLSRISARVLIDLESESVAKRLQAYSRMIMTIEGWKDLDGNSTDDCLEAPVEALEAAATEFVKKAADLPKA
jgi:hypothetical protein